MTFGQKLRELRIEAGFTQAQLGALVGRHDSAIKAWESDTARPNFETLAELALLFGVTSDYLIGIEATRGSRKKSTYFFQAFCRLHHGEAEQIRARLKREIEEGTVLLDSGINLIGKDDVNGSSAVEIKQAGESKGDEGDV